MTTASPVQRLDARSLGRAWWRLPLLMAVCLIVLCYAIAALFHARNMGGWWPLLIGGGLGFAGIVNGFNFNGRIWSMIGKRAGVAYLPADHGLTRRVHALAAQAGLPAPKVGIMHGMNAYASGPNAENAVVVLGVPLVKRLTSDELNAVIGHELGHIATGDVRRMQYGEGFQFLLSGLFAFPGKVLAGVAPEMGRMGADQGVVTGVGKLGEWLGRWVVGLAGEFLLKASSRTREYHADAIGAALSSPAAMISALEKVHRADVPPTAAEKDFAYMMFRGAGGRLFATHPTLEQRRAALQEGGYVRRLPTLASSIQPQESFAA